MLLMYYVILNYFLRTGTACRALCVLFEKFPENASVSDNLTGARCTVPVQNDADILSVVGFPHLTKNSYVCVR